MNSNWSYSPETKIWVVTSVTLTFDLWPWPFAWTLPWSNVITPENFMMIRWWEHSQKGVTDGQTDRRTENAIHRAAWSQLKIAMPASSHPYSQWMPHHSFLYRWCKYTIVFQKCCHLTRSLDQGDPLPHKPCEQHDFLQFHVVFNSLSLKNWDTTSKMKNATQKLMSWDIQQHKNIACKKKGGAAKLRGELTANSPRCSGEVKWNSGEWAAM